MVRLDGEWRGRGWGRVQLSDGEGSYTDTYGPRPGKLKLEERPDGHFAGTWGEEDRDRHGRLAVHLSPDLGTLVGSYQASSECSIGPLEVQPMLLRRLSWLFDEPVPARWSQILAARQALGERDGFADCVFRLRRGAQELRVELDRYEGIDDVTFGVDMLVPGGPVYRRPATVALPHLRLRRQTFIDDVKAALRLDHEVTSGHEALDDVAFISACGSQRAVDALLARAQVTDAMWRLFEFGAYDLRLNEVSPVAEARFRRSADEPLDEAALVEALERFEGLIAALLG